MTGCDRCDELLDRLGWTFELTRPDDPDADRELMRKVIHRRHRGKGGWSGKADRTTGVRRRRRK